MQFENDKDHFFHKKKAADLLAKSHQAENAVNLYKEIIDKLLSKNRAKAENELLIDTILCYAQIAVSFYPPATVLEVIKKAKLQAEPLRNDRENALLELCLGRIEEMQGKGIIASSHYKKASDLAKKGGDQELLIKISKQLALSLFWQGRVKEAIRLYEGIVGDTKTRPPKMEDAWAYLMLAFCYGIAGQTPRAFDLALTIKNLAEAKKYPKFQGFSNVFIALILTEANLVEQAKPYYEKGMEIGEKIGSDFVLWLAKKCMAYAFYSKGDLEKARDYLESAFYHCIKFGRHHNSCGWHF
jgi:tetratricopeptide (TPR) repeat protein